MQLAVSTSQSHIMMRRRKNVWYSMRDGNWSDPNTWISNALDRKLITVPQPGDDVVINHNVTYDNTSSGTFLFNQNINDLTINGKLLWASGSNQSQLIVKGNLKCSGTLDLSGSTGGGGAFLSIGGNANYIVNFVTGNSTSNITIYYTSQYDFIIPNISYYNLRVGGGNIKSISTDLSVSGMLSVDAGTTFELGDFNTTVGDLSINGSLNKNSSSGLFTVTNAIGSDGSGVFNKVNFSGSPTINWSGNMVADLRSGVNFGSGIFNILTNSNWTFSNSGNVPGSIGTCNFVIASAKTLTLNGSAAWINNGTVNGVDGTSTLNISTQYCYGNNNTVMATGVFNHNFSGTSTIWTSGTINVPVLTYYNLHIYTGTSTFVGNVTVSNALTIDATLQLATYNLTVNGLTTSGGIVLKSGAGTVNFSTLSIIGKVDFSTGNPTVNISGNVSGDCRSGVNFGSNAVNITASITWGTWTSGNVAYQSNWNILIASGKTLTNVGLGSSFGGIFTTGTITGADATAIFDNRSMMTYNNAIAPMATGKLYCNQAANTFTYGLAGNQDISAPSDPTPGYQNLTLQGSGAKKLSGNVSVKATYTLTAPATLNTNGFSLTNP